MAHYEFLTTWGIEAPIERVFDVLVASTRYPTWWKGVTSVEIVAPGDGIQGEVDRFTWRSVLPYSLAFDMQVTRVVRPFLIEGRASGELEGIGTWHLSEGRDATVVVYEWQVRTTRRWMNLLGPLARPAFAWNHDLVMRQGGRGLAAELGVRLLFSD